MKRKGLFLYANGAIAGAAAVYFLDRRKGAQRRRAVMDRSRHWVRGSQASLRRGLVDTQNRIGGFFARHIHPARPVSNEILVARVRSKLGRWVSHPGAIEVTAREGCVRLGGYILRHEIGPLIQQVRRVRGVHSVYNQLEPRAQGGHVPSLQGSSRAALAEYPSHPRERPPAYGPVISVAAGAWMAIQALRSFSRPWAGSLLTPLLILTGFSVLRFGNRKRNHTIRESENVILEHPPLLEAGPLLSVKSVASS
jgi:hypothetical protein